MSKQTFLKIVALAKPEWKGLLAATIFLAIGSASWLAFPQALSGMVKGALSGPLAQPGTSAGPAMAQASQQDINHAALWLLVLVGVSGAAFAARFWMFSRVGERVVSSLRKRLFAHILSQEIGFFDGEKTGDLTSRITTDTGTIQSAVSANISMLLRNFANVAGGLTMLFFTSVKLTGLMLSVVPAVALFAVLYGRRVRKLAREVQDAVAKSNDAAQEALSGIRTVRSFAAEKAEQSRYDRAVDEGLVLSLKRIRHSSTFIGLASAAANGAFVIVFWFGWRMVVSGELSIDRLFAFISYSFMVAFSLGGLVELYTDMNRAAGATERVFELLERTPRIPLSGGKTLPAVSGTVRWARVHFAYPTRKDVAVLKDFDLTLHPGEVVALVGPSGAGKSTIASLLYRLYDPDSGRLELDGVPLTDIDPSWLRSQIGVVAQEPLLFSSSILDNIRYGRPSASDPEVEEAARLANAHSFIAAFPEGYQTLVGERGIKLSGGQKQRVAIARAILKNPRILILDEATSALDAESEHLVHEALDRLMEGRTTLVIAHRLSTVKDADRVVVLEDGAVGQIGSHAELLATEGTYRRLVERQFAA